MFYFPDMGEMLHGSVADKVLCALEDYDMHLHNKELDRELNREIVENYGKSAPYGGWTHYLMQGGNVVFIGTLPTLKNFTTMLTSGKKS